MRTSGFTIFVKKEEAKEFSQILATFLSDLDFCLYRPRVKRVRIKEAGID
jgi:hypothetical protein